MSTSQAQGRDIFEKHLTHSEPKLSLDSDVEKGEGQGQGQPGLRGQLEASLGFLVLIRLCVKKKKKN